MVSSVIHTLLLADVSMGKLKDTVVHESFHQLEKTVNCCQHVQDLKAIGNSRYRNINLLDD